MADHVSRAVAAVACFAVALMLARPARADDVITPESVAGKNIRAAEEFIRSTGNTALADNIEAFLVGGRFYSGDLTDKAGVTSAFNNITLDKTTVVAPLTAPINPTKIEGFTLILKLAGTITHEKKHAHQSVRDKINPWWKEYDAWTTEILEVDSWIRWLRGEARKTPTPQNQERVKEAVSVKIETLTAFINTEKCFGYPCDAWTNLLETIQLLQERLLAEKPGKPEDPKVGSLIDKAGHDEQVAQAQAPAPGTPPPAPPPGVPTPPVSTPTHRVASCPACGAKADELNAASDKFADASGADTATRAALQADVQRLSHELDDCEAKQCAKSVPQVGMATPPAPAAASSTGVDLGVRVGVGIPLGDAASGDRLGDGVAAGIPFELEGGYRFGQGFVVGAYFDWGPLFDKNCAPGASCSGWDMGFGAEGQYHFHTTPMLDPWAGIATGYEILHGSQSSGSASTSSSLSGFQFVTLQGGADYAFTDVIAGGPFLSFSLGEFTSESSSGVAGVPASSGSIPQKALHEWLTLGVRGTYDVPLN